MNEGDMSPPSSFDDVQLWEDIMNEDYDELPSIHGDSSVPGSLIAAAAERGMLINRIYK